MTSVLFLDKKGEGRMAPPDEFRHRMSSGGVICTRVPSFTTPCENPRTMPR